MKTLLDLCHINDILQMNDELLMKKCKDLEVSLSQGENHDIEAIELY